MMLDVIEIQSTKKNKSIDRKTPQISTIQRNNRRY